MKRTLLIFAILCMATGVSAQQETGTWSVTPRVGVNSSTLSVEDVYHDDGNGDMVAASAKHKWGLTAGVEGQYQAWQQLGISFGVMYSNEGYDFGKVADVGEWKQSLHFLSIPVLANFYIEPDLLPGLALKAGVQVGYLLQGKETLYGITATNTDAFHRVNVSIPAGISYEYRHFVADLRYNIGVTNLCRSSALDETWRTGSLWLTLGYRFGL